MDDLDKLLNDLQGNSIPTGITNAKISEDGSASQIKLNDFENIMKLPSEGGGSPAAFRGSRQQKKYTPASVSTIALATSIPRTPLPYTHNIPKQQNTNDITTPDGMHLDQATAEKLAAAKKVLSQMTPAQRAAVKFPTKSCAICGLSIVKSGAILNGKSYHNEHFTCNVCNASLKGVLVYEKNDLLWCERDYHIAFSPECFYCKERITDESGIEALGQTFHPDHFFCAQCGESLVNKTFREYQGKAFCSEDYATLFANRCAQCLQPLLEDYITALSKNYHKDHFKCTYKDCNKILTVNGFYNQDNMPYCEYHFYQLSDNICTTCNGIILGRCVVAFGKKFHAAHFRCAFCQKELDSGEGGYKGKSGKAYCPACYVKIFA